jgi:acetyltransferase-like isoleucine patch superfamily enzyme
LDDGFIEEVRHGLDAFRALSSETKIDLYRRHGARIGEAVRIESGAVILAREIDIGAAATIGSDSTIECERLRLGRLAAFGKRTRVHCRSVQIGDALWSKDNVVIGGGGSAEADAHLEIGDAAFIGEGAYLNVGRRITLGDEVCVGSRAMLFTHSHWQSILRGYSSLFAPIVVGDHVFIGNGAFIFPGVTIGSGSTVMVNSFVAANVAANVMVGGVPAQVIRHLKLPSRSEQVEIFRARLTDLVRVLEERGYLVKAAENDDGIVFQIDGDALIRFTNSAEWSNTGSDGRRLILLAFPAAPRDSAPPGVTLFDLTASRVAGLQDPLSDEVREFCRRRGIRFRPFAWRYRVGHFEGDRFIPR